MPALQADQPDPDAPLLESLRVGDERAFVTLVERYHPSMLRIAAGYVPSAAVAEEVVQDTWLGVLRGLRQFEGRSSVRTWLFRILVNRARTAGAKERRSLAISDLTTAVDSARFDATGHWLDPPLPFSDLVDDQVTAERMASLVRTAMAGLPPRQREVVTLRDIEGLSSEEVRDVLDISDANQRVLLHRARSRLRQLLESEFGRA